jgi:hypothetical protein
MPPRSFSSLKAFCSAPEGFPQRPHPRRDAAAAAGTRYHAAVELWARTGSSAHFDTMEEPLRSWLLRMREAWAPPEDLEVEVCLGLEDLPYPKYVPAVERPEGSHEYHAQDGKTPLLTAGRADLVWREDETSIVRVADIKTGSSYLGDPGKLRQVLAQGFAALSRNPHADAFVPGVYYARTGQFDWGQPLEAATPEYQEAWRWVLDAAKRDATPRPGPHCLSCWEKKQCPANPEIATAA